MVALAPLSAERLSFLVSRGPLPRYHGMKSLDLNRPLVVMMTVITAGIIVINKKKQIQISISVGLSKCLTNMAFCCTLSVPP